MRKINKKQILDNLKYYYPEAKIELNYKQDYELLLATMLSAQTTDKRVNMVTKDLFKKYDTLEKLDSLSITEVEEAIKTIGMYRQKAHNFKSIVKHLISIGGSVPNNRDELTVMSGVGRKTANVVLNVLYGVPSIAVDTHVFRVSKRLGLAPKEANVLEVEECLMKKFNKKDWNDLHLRLVLFGRYYCTAKKPKCDKCKFKCICKEWN